MNTALPAHGPGDLPLEFSDADQGRHILGVWAFLASDVVLFCCLFASYAVYRGRVASGPTPAELFGYGPALLETMLLLSSSFTCSLAIHEMRRGRARPLSAMLVLTTLLGAGFVAMELHDFTSIVALGHTWHQSAFLSAFFTLVGTHGAHVSFGILWALALLAQLARRGLTPITARKVYTFALYWHFLDIVWIFIFSFVYLIGKVG